MHPVNTVQENGEKLVGQCEISHPVPAFTGHSPDGFSTTSNETDMFDGMGEAISQQHNVMFDHQSKDQYSPLPARISRMFRSFVKLERH